VFDAENYRNKRPPAVRNRAVGEVRNLAPSLLIGKRKCHASFAIQLRGKPAIYTIERRLFLFVLHGDVVQGIP
jgi:hypothetical protein